MVAVANLPNLHQRRGQMDLRAHLGAHDTSSARTLPGGSQTRVMPMRAMPVPTQRQYRGSTYAKAVPWQYQVPTQWQYRASTFAEAVPWQYQVPMQWQYRASTFAEAVQWEYQVPSQWQYRGSTFTVAVPGKYLRSDSTVAVPFTWALARPFNAREDARFESN